MNIFVGNLSFRTMESELRGAFEQYGEVSRVNIPTDHESGRPRGFGFVEMPTRSEAEAAISALNGVQLGGRELAVNEARPKPNGNARSGSARGNTGGRDRYGDRINNRRSW